jgi:hypothetical protein
MSGFAVLIVALAIGVPIAWFASEFQTRRWLRLTLGCFAILLSFAVADLVGSVERFNANAWFSLASKELVDATVAELEAGNRDGVLRSLKTLQQKYEPTYENRARYDALVAETVADMRTRSSATHKE